MCNQSFKNRICGLKYTKSFDETYLNTGMWYLDPVSIVVKPNKFSTNWMSGCGMKRWSTIVSSWWVTILVFCSFLFLLNVGQFRLDSM